MTVLRILKNYLVKDHGINNWSLSSTFCPLSFVVVAEVKYLLEIWTAFLHRIRDIFVDSEID